MCDVMFFCDHEHFLHAPVSLIVVYRIKPLPSHVCHEHMINISAIALLSRPVLMCKEFHHNFQYTVVVVID